MATIRDIEEAIAKVCGIKKKSEAYSNGTYYLNILTGEDEHIYLSFEPEPDEEIIESFGD